LELCIDETNKSFQKTESKISIENLSFPELKNKFWNNHYKLRKLKRTDKVYDEILEEDIRILKQVSIINRS
jgi:hypothetical protein